MTVGLRRGIVIPGQLGFVLLLLRRCGRGAGAALNVRQLACTLRIARTWSDIDDLLKLPLPTESMHLSWGWKGVGVQGSCEASAMLA